MPVKFCAECQNMLYPREGRDENGVRKLVYVCKACDNEEVIDDTSVPVFRNVIVHTAEYVSCYAATEGWKQWTIFLL